MLPVEILSEIFSYLPYKDLLRVRLVCQRWKAATSLSNFLSKTKLTLAEHNYLNFVNYLKKDNIKFITYNCELKCFKCEQMDLKFVMNTIGEHIRYLILPSEMAYSKFYASLSNLRKIHIIIIANNIHFKEQNISDAINLGILPKLNAIELTANNNCSEEFSTVKYSYLNMLKNAESLNLQHFTINFIDEQIETSLLCVLKNHVNSIQYLHLTFITTPIRENSSSWSEFFSKLINLNTIKLSGKCPLDWLSIIFDSVPTAANISYIDLSGLSQVNSMLLTKIVNKWPDKLQYLELMFCNRIADRNFQVLNLTKRNLLVLNIARCSNITSKDLLKAIDEENKTLKEMYLTDLKELDEACICKLAKRLPNMEVLHLDNCRVTNRVLAYIFHYQKRLKCLVLDDCKQITDEGFGTSELFKDSLNSLSRLQILSLRNCHKLTDRFLEKCALPNLVSLKICYCHRISINGIKSITLKCSSIETLYVSSCPKVTDECVLVLCQYLRNLICLNISNCPNLTELVIDHIAKHCESLKELIMCGFSSWNFNVIKRKLQLKSNIKLVNT